MLGAVVGAVLFTTMGNAAVLLGVDPFWEMVLEGLLIALVVYLDNLQEAATGRRLRLPAGNGDGSVG